MILSFMTQIQGKTKIEECSGVYFYPIELSQNYLTKQKVGKYQKKMWSCLWLPPSRNSNIIYLMEISLSMGITNVCHHASL